MDKYYAVTLVRGHQGARVNKGLITFYVKAQNSLEAMDKGRAMPGVKHTRLPVGLREVSKEEYTEMVKTSAYDRAGCKKYC